MLKPFKHQEETAEFIFNTGRCLVTSDPGTGKTRSVIDAYAKLKKLHKKPGRMLVLAPLSILEASWADDITKFAPHLTFAVAYSRKRETAFLGDADIVITNHDAVKWLVQNQHFLADFDTLCIDEFTAFKNKDSQRSKAALKLSRLFEYRVAMSGTPNANTILDIWHPTLLIDEGHRLGRRFFGFRESVCTPTFNGFAHVWNDKPNAEGLVAVQIADINIRYSLEECLDMPEKTTNYMYTTLPDNIRKQYETLKNDSVLFTGKETINAINAGVLTRKLLQLCTGSVYTQDGVAESIHSERYELVIDLVSQRKHSLVAFNWRHERDELVRLAKKNKITYEVIDGSTPAEQRANIVRRFQAGQLQTVFCHPQSAGHGLTLTKANTTIWCSPTYNAEHFQQFNRRIYRAGQTQKTETILIAAKDTWETDVYQKLETKLTKIEDLLTILMRSRT
jgi:SNF2 family DNA or RNA helicase